MIRRGPLSACSYGYDTSTSRSHAYLPCFKKTKRRSRLLSFSHFSPYISQLPLFKKGRPSPFLLTSILLWGALSQQFLAILSEERFNLCDFAFEMWSMSCARVGLNQRFLELPSCKVKRRSLWRRTPGVCCLFSPTQNGKYNKWYGFFRS